MTEPTRPSGRQVCLDAAKAAVVERGAAYAPPSKNFARIAALWSVILDKPITVVDVALCMDAVKTARLMESPDHADSWIDKAGYGACGFEVTRPK